MRALLLALAAAAASTAACHDPDAYAPRWQVAGGDPHRGRVAIGRYGCGACHMIPGVDDAVGTAGPPLIAFGRRGYIAGRLPNLPDSLIRWVMEPQRYEPGHAMPNMGVSEPDARDIAAYLYTLR